MRVLSSLTNRIFLGSAVLAVLTIAMAVSRFNVAVTAATMCTRGVAQSSGPSSRRRSRTSGAPNQNHVIPAPISAGAIAAAVPP